MHVLARQREGEALAPATGSLGIALGDRHELHLSVLRARHRDARPLEQPNTALHDRLEHRLHVGRRAADDPQNVCGRGLPLEGFTRLVEKADVLDGDYRLRGKCFEQELIAVCEGPDHFTAHDDYADHLPVLQQGHPDQAPAHARRQLCRPDAQFAHEVVGIGQAVIDPDRGALEQDSARERLAAGTARALHVPLHERPHVFLLRPAAASHLDESGRLPTQ